MRPDKIESWALAVIRRVQAGQPVEDVRVELKSKWPDDPYRAARRIAGHANAAHGEPILWLIGVDEDSKQVTGADYLEIANWWPKIQSFFAELPPDLIHLNVPYDDKTVVALLFRTERRPFVVKVPGGGPIDLEVPWRDATVVRSAKRRELVAILTAPAMNPSVEVMSGLLYFSRKRVDGGHEGPHVLDLYAFVIPHSNEPVVIPFHKCEAKLRIPGSETPYAFRSVHFVPSDQMVDCSDSKVVIREAGKVAIRAEPPDTNVIPLGAGASNVQVELNLWPALSEVPIPIIVNFIEQPSGQDGVRKYEVQRD